MKQGMMRRNNSEMHQIDLHNKKKNKKQKNEKRKTIYSKENIVTILQYFLPKR